MHKSSLEGVYDLISAEDPIPLVFDSPHSGTCFPEDFHPACSSLASPLPDMPPAGRRETFRSTCTRYASLRRRA